MRPMTFDYDGGLAGLGPRRVMPKALRVTRDGGKDRWSLIAEEDGHDREFAVEAMVQTFLLEGSATHLLPIEGHAGVNGQLTAAGGIYAVHAFGKWSADHPAKRWA